MERAEIPVVILNSSHVQDYARDYSCITSIWTVEPHELEFDIEIERDMGFVKSPKKYYALPLYSEFIYPVSNTILYILRYYGFNSWQNYKEFVLREK